MINVVLSVVSFAILKCAFLKLLETPQGTSKLESHEQRLLSAAKLGEDWQAIVTKVSGPVRRR